MAYHLHPGSQPCRDLVSTCSFRLYTLFGTQLCIRKFYPPDISASLLPRALYHQGGIGFPSLRPLEAYRMANNPVFLSSGHYVLSCWIEYPNPKHHRQNLQSQTSSDHLLPSAQPLAVYAN